MTLSRRLVRKDGIDSVLLTDVAPLGGNRFACAGQMPRAHSLINDSVPPRYDFYNLALSVELGRQAAIAAVHKHLEVPFSRKLIFTSLEHTAVDPEPNDWMPMPVPIEIEMTLEPKFQDGELVAAESRFVYEVDGRPRIQSSGRFKVKGRDDYEAFRSDYRARRPVEASPEEMLGDPIEPAAVGRLDPRNVFLAEPRRVEDGFEALILPDQQNTFFFDHPDEHVPGTQLIEALNQVAIVCAARAHDVAPEAAVVTQFRATFLAFAELDRPLTCEVQVAEPSTDSAYAHVPLKLTLRQPHAKVGKCTMTLRFNRAVAR